MTFLTLLQRILALLSLIVLVAAGYFLWTWWDVQDFARDGLTNAGARENWRLYLGAALLAWSFLGAAPVRLLLGRSGGEGRRLQRGEGTHVDTPDGSRIYVESHGPDDAPVLVFTHGWGMDSTTWIDARRRLGQRFRLIVWDLPGLGRSNGPKDGRYSLDRFADALAAVIDLAGRRQVILVGHSIGGMIIQTLARNHPGRFGTQVVGTVLENTTHTNPLNTTFLSSILRPLQPLLTPLMHLDIWLSPLVWLMNWQSYLSGSTHIAMRLSGFGTQPTRDLLEQAALLATRNSPAVQAKGNLAMMRWDATDDLARLRVPALVFTGGRDLVTKARAGEIIAQSVPQGRREHVAQAGHMGPQECADLYNRALSSFADTVFARGALAADRKTDPMATPAPFEGEARTIGPDLNPLP
jgi:pimeloyl-ACP methyl ester carboxylesterase